MWALLIATMTVETEYELADPNLFVDDPVMPIMVH
jgi:hypothetical protein